MNVLFADEQDEPIVTDELLRLAEIVLEEEGLEAETGVSLVLIDAAQMTQLNETHMGKDGPTDVLSFPLEAATPWILKFATRIWRVISHLKFMLCYAGHI